MTDAATFRLTRYGPPALSLTLPTRAITGQRIISRERIWREHGLEFGGTGGPLPEPTWSVLGFQNKGI